MSFTYRQLEEINEELVVKAEEIVKKVTSSLLLKE